MGLMVGFMVFLLVICLFDRILFLVGIVVVYKYLKDENSIIIKVFINDINYLNIN